MIRETPAPRGQSGRPVLRDLPVLPVPQEVKDRLDHLDRLERLALVVLMEIQIQRRVPENLVVQDPRIVLEEPALLVILDRKALLDLLELLTPRNRGGPS